jgi:hypothetical protein
LKNVERLLGLTVKISAPRSWASGGQITQSLSLPSQANELNGGQTYHESMAKQIAGHPYPGFLFDYLSRVAPVVAPHEALASPPVRRARVAI